MAPREDAARKPKRWRAREAVVTAAAPVDAREQDSVGSFRMKEAFFHAAKSLDARVQKRPLRVLHESDRDFVRLMQGQMEEWMACNAWASRLKDVMAIEVPGVMWRVHLFHGEGITVRLHLFEDPSETFIHNHQSSFFSCCLKGEYWHRMWGVDSADQACRHFAVKRSGDDEFAECPGQLRVQLGCDHVEGACYFIHASTAHTVCPRLDGSRPVPVVTMVVKGLDRMCDTWVRCNTLSSCEEVAEHTPADRKLGNTEKRSLLQHMHHLLRGHVPRQKTKTKGKPQSSAKLMHGHEEFDFALE